MHEAGLFGLAEHRVGLLLRDGAAPGLIVEEIGFGCDAEADLEGMVAALVQKPFLLPADAFVDGKRLTGFDDSGDPIEGQRLLRGGGVLLDGDGPHHPRLLPEELPPEVLVVLVAESREFRVQVSDLHLPDADDPGKHPEDPCRPEPGALDLPLLPHTRQHLVELIEWTPSALGDLDRRLEAQSEVAEEFGLLGREDLLENPDLEPAVRSREAVRERVEEFRQLAVDVITHDLEPHVRELLYSPCCRFTNSGRARFAQKGAAPPSDY